MKAEKDGLWRGREEELSTKLLAGFEYKLRIHTLSRSDRLNK
jgi:hypothetical protein